MESYSYQRIFTPDRIKDLEPNEVFVFGSNRQGYHGGGAARVASTKFGAVWGKGVGFYGQSYAIPTMDGSVEAIKPYVAQFIEFAKQHPELTFYVTRIGCGIAGFKVQQIAPLFKEAIYIENIILPKDFVEVILNISNLSINSAMNKTHSGIIGAIAGDCFGAIYEFQPVKSAAFDLYKAPRFTDDTVMTLAVAKWLTID